MILSAVDAHRLNMSTFFRSCVTCSADMLSSCVWCSANPTPCLSSASYSMMTKVITLAALICGFNPHVLFGFYASSVDPESSVDDLLSQFMVAYRNDN